MGEERNRDKLWDEAIEKGYVSYVEGSVGAISSENKFIEDHNNERFLREYKPGTVRGSIGPNQKTGEFEFNGYNVVNKEGEIIFVDNNAAKWMNTESIIKYVNEGGGVCDASYNRDLSAFGKVYWKQELGGEWEVDKYISADKKEWFKKYGEELFGKELFEKYEREVSNKERIQRELSKQEEELKKDGSLSEGDKEAIRKLRNEIKIETEKVEGAELGTGTKALSKAGGYAKKILAKYAKFCEEHPLLARWGTDILNIAFQTMVAGPVGALNGVRATAVGEGIGMVVGEELGEAYVKGVDLAAIEMQKEFPGLDYEDAAALVGLGAMIGLVGIQGSSAFKILKKHIDFKDIGGSLKHKMGRSDVSPSDAQSKFKSKDTGSSVEVDKPKINEGVESNKLKVDGDISSKNVEVNSDFNTQFSKRGGWGHWSDYEKIVINGKEYAKIGEWLYTRHAVENLYPSKMGRAAGHTSNHDHLTLPPKYVNDILSNKNTPFKEVTKDGVSRKIYDTNDIRIITEGKVVITIYKNKINK